MDITVTRLNSLANILQFWENFKVGFEVLELKTGESFPVAEMFPLLQHLVICPTAYICVARDESGVFRGFLVAKDATEPFSKRKVSYVRAIWHTRGDRDVGRQMILKYEIWLKEGGYTKYLLSSNKRHGSPAERYYVKNFGAHKVTTIFEKVL